VSYRRGRRAQSPLFLAAVRYTAHVKAPALTASKVLTKVKTRDGLREFVLRELPGWEPWLTLAAADIQSRAWDEHLLKTERELLEDIQAFAAEFVTRVGADAERFFRSFTQRRPLHDIDGDLPAAEAFTNAPGSMPFCHADLGDALPSRALIGLIGALGLRQQERKTGRTENKRLIWALDWVCLDLMPFVKSERYEGGRAGEPIAPLEYDREPSFPIDRYRRAPLTMTFAAVVALYLSLPNRTDPDAPADASKLELAASALDEATARLRTRGSAPGFSGRARTAFDDEAALRLKALDAEQALSGRIKSQIPPVTVPAEVRERDEPDASSLRHPRC
jgi:hypothetical protein